MQSIDHVVETYLNQKGQPLPRVTLGAVSCDGNFLCEIRKWIPSLIAFRVLPLCEVFQW
jgi:hypothetical protein